MVVSLYNYADRAEALWSVRAQTQRLELIVVDDASTDEGMAVVERWIDSASTMVIILWGSAATC